MRQSPEKSPMSFRFTTRLPLSRHAVDRDHTVRATPGLLHDLGADADTRVLVLWHGKALLEWPPVSEVLTRSSSPG